MSAPSHIVAAAAEAMPSEQGISELRDLATRWVSIEREKEALAARISELEAQSSVIRTRELPELFARLGTDNIGLPDAGVDVVVADYYKANIAADWEQDRQNAAFKWLEDNGHGALIRMTVSVSFGKGEIELARELQDLIRTQFSGANSHPIEVKMGIPWNSLTSFVRERHKAGDVLPLETLGATVGMVAKIKERKTK